MRRLSFSPTALLVTTLLGWASSAAADEGGVSLFFRADSDQTTVISPRVSASATLPDDRTTVRGAYMADVWTGASIDVRTAASYRRPRDPSDDDPPIRAITEQRDQIDFSATHEGDDVTLGGSYYFSGEHDYWSHGFNFRISEELFGNSTTLEQAITYNHDIIGRAGDPTFEESLDGFGWRLVWTQILTPEAILQVAYDGSYRIGFQSSVYRYVGLGGDDTICGSAGQDLDRNDPLLCVPESHPRERQRNAFVLRGRFAFGQSASAGLGYRFYFDTWGVLSHTARAQIAWIPERNQTITLRYRFYTQSAAFFYRNAYPVPAPNSNIFGYTRDRELSPTFSNRLALSYMGRWQIAEEVSLKFAIAIGGTVFVYPDFAGLDEVYALDTTIAFTLEL